MRNHNFKKFLSLMLSIALIAAAAMLFAGCGAADETPLTKTFSDGDVLGQGATTFTLIFMDTDGTTATAEIHTDKTTVGAALLELELIEGEDGPYGIYIKTVNGVTYDYEADGVYWSLLIDGEYAMSGVDDTDIVPGTTYTLKAEKGE